MNGPTIIYGKTANTLWYDAPDGSLLVDVGGEIAHFHREPNTGSFLFDHDSLLDGIDGEVVTHALRDGRGNFIRFATGPVLWEVEDHDQVHDLYLCRPSQRRPH